MIKTKVLRNTGGQYRFRVRLSLAKAIDQTIKEQQQEMIKETPNWFAITSKWYLSNRPTGYRISRTKLVRGEKNITGEIYTYNDWSVRQEIGGYQDSFTTPIYGKSGGKIYKSKGGMNARYAGFLKKVWRNKRIGESAKERQSSLKRVVTVRRGKKAAVFFDRKTNSLKVVKNPTIPKKSKPKQSAKKDRFYVLLKPLSGSNSSTFLVTKPRAKKKGIKEPVLLSVNKSNMKIKGKGQIKKQANIYMPKVVYRLKENLIKVSKGLRV